MHEALRACAEHLSTYGGHDAAAGLSLHSSRLDAFTRAMIDHANARIAEEQLTAVLHIDCDAEASELDRGTVERIGQLGPFGAANRAPALLLRGMTLAEAPQALGGQGRHIALRIRPSNGQRGPVLRSVWWNASDVAGQLAAGMRLDAVIEPKLNRYAGTVSVEGEVKDVRIGK
jgi:single-stranded-DNA-specific exonuclease